MSSDENWDDVWDDEDDEDVDEDAEWDSVWEDTESDVDIEEEGGDENDESAESNGEADGDTVTGPDADAEAEVEPGSEETDGATWETEEEESTDADDSPPAAADTGSVDSAGDDDIAALDDADDGSMFEENFAAALEEAPSSPDEGGAARMDEADVDVGGGEFDVGGGDFGGADFGMGGGVGDDSGFEEEDFESDIPRIDVGIEGLDEMIQAGVPERSLMVAIGSAGTGKTTFGLQFLDHALEQGERAIYITLEESRDRIVNSATEKGMAFDEYAADGQLAIVDFDPVEMAHSLGSIRSELPDLIQEFGATRVVLDSVSLLEMMYDDRARRRNEIYDFTESLKHAGVTTMLTSEAAQSDPYASRHGIVEYLTDAVFVLQYVRPDDFRETRLAVEIQKIRDANHSRETKPYEITDEGIDVYRQANIF